MLPLRTIFNAIAGERPEVPIWLLAWFVFIDDDVRRRAEKRRRKRMAPEQPVRKRPQCDCPCCRHPCRSYRGPKPPAPRPF